MATGPEKVAPDWLTSQTSRTELLDAAWPRVPDQVPVMFTGGEAPDGEQPHEKLIPSTRPRRDVRIQRPVFITQKYAPTGQESAQRVRVRSAKAFPTIV